MNWTTIIILTQSSNYSPYSNPIDSQYYTTVNYNKSQTNRTTTRIEYRTAKLYNDSKVNKQWIYFLQMIK